MKISKYFAFFTAAIFVAFFASSQAYAADVDTVIGNIRGSTTNLPGLMAGVSYLLGILLAVLAVTKTIDHVSNPAQTPLKAPVIRFLIGAGLFALPMITDAAYRTINGGGAATAFSTSESVTGLSALQAIADVSAATQITFNALLSNITDSTTFIPGLIAMIGYMLGILLSISALLKMRDHVDEPERTTLKEPVIRLLIAGALFALPTVYDAMYTTIADGGLGTLGSVMFTGTLLSVLLSSDMPGFAIGPIAIAGVGCTPLALLETSLGAAICSLELNTIGLPTFLAVLSYVLGLVFGLWALFKIRDHVINPAQTGLSEGVTRLIAGGAFFAMPFVANVMTTSITTGPLAAFQMGVGTNTGFNETLTCGSILAPIVGTNSLDEAFGCFMADVAAPLQAFINFFCLVAGMIFIMIGISRLVKSSQEGARGPGGRGTVATFVTGGVLISANAIMRAVSTSIFVNPITRTNANLTYTTGMTVAEQQATHNVISAVLKFMIIIGLISFVRGIFIMRDVAEGNQQASTMSGITHIIGGALAVNLGPLLNAVQASLGVTAFGITFT